MEAEMGRWSGPLASVYGLHFVWLHEREPARLPTLDEVRTRVEGAVYDQREKRAMRDTLTHLRKSVVVRAAELERGPALPVPEGSASQAGSLEPRN